MNHNLHHRLKSLERWVAPVRIPPLRIHCPTIPVDFQLSPGERIVEDEIAESESYALVVTVHERITADSHDHGKRYRCHQDWPGSYRAVPSEQAARS